MLCSNVRAHPLKPHCHWNGHFQYSIVLTVIVVVVVVSYYFLTRGFSVAFVFFLGRTQDWFFQISQFLLDSQRVRIVRLFSQHNSFVCLLASRQRVRVLFMRWVRASKQQPAHIAPLWNCRNRAFQWQRLIGRRLAVVCCNLQKGRLPVAYVAADGAADVVVVL